MHRVAARAVAVTSNPTNRLIALMTVTILGVAVASNANAADLSVESTASYSNRTRGLELAVEYEPSDSQSMTAAVGRQWGARDRQPRENSYEVEVEWLPIEFIDTVSRGVSAAYEDGTERDNAIPRVSQYARIVQGIAQWYVTPALKLKVKAGPSFERSPTGWVRTGKYDFAASNELTDLVELEWRVSDGDYVAPKRKLFLCWNLFDEFEITAGYQYDREAPTTSVAFE